MAKKIGKNKVIHSFSEVDLTSIAIPSIVIYRHPEDFQDQCVARVYAGSSPTNIIMLADSVEELRQDIEKECEQCIWWFGRMPADPESVVGVYIL